MEALITVLAAPLVFLLLCLTDLRGWRNRFGAKKIASTQTLLWLPGWLVPLIPYLCIAAILFTPTNIYSSKLPFEVSKIVIKIYGRNLNLLVVFIFIGIFVWSTCIYFLRRNISFKGDVFKTSFVRLNNSTFEVHLNPRFTKTDFQITPFHLLLAIKEHITLKNLIKMRESGAKELIVASIWMNLPKVSELVLKRLESISSEFSIESVENYKLGLLTSIHFRVFQIFVRLFKLEEINNKIIYYKVVYKFNDIEIENNSKFFSRPLMSGFSVKFD